jgi:glutamine synthetase
VPRCARSSRSIVAQEYTLFEPDGETPYGWPKNAYPSRPQGPYYCSVGTENAYGRAVAEAHYKACMYAGIEISGINGEVMPGQWEYQVGPCTGIEGSDQLIISRYLLCRVCELFGIVVSFDPKPIPGDWNGAGCHTNVSTTDTRVNGGYKSAIKKYMDRLGAPGKQDEHIAAYDPSGGLDNQRRLTGAHETASYKEFSWGVANRGCSVRSPSHPIRSPSRPIASHRMPSHPHSHLISSHLIPIPISSHPTSSRLRCASRA